jgi:hypothetical protein
MVNTKSLMMQHATENKMVAFIVPDSEAQPAYYRGGSVVAVGSASFFFQLKAAAQSEMHWNAQWYGPNKG